MRSNETLTGGLIWIPYPVEQPASLSQVTPDGLGGCKGGHRRSFRAEDSGSQAKSTKSGFGRPLYLVAAETALGPDEQRDATARVWQLVDAVSCMRREHESLLVRGPP